MFCILRLIQAMFKKFFLLVIVVAILIAWLSGIFCVSFSPFSLTISKIEKDFLKQAVTRISNLIYQEATVHNPPGDMLPDWIDNRLRREAKERIN